MDGGSFLTLPLAYSEHPVSGKANIGMYRNQIFDDGLAGMHFQIHRGMGFHYHEAEKKNNSLPVNVFLGGPPSLIMSAIAPLPENIPEAVLASLLQGNKLRILKNPEISLLPVIADAEFALIGRVPPKVRHIEGPFGDHTGYYNAVEEFPVFTIERMTQRQQPLYHSTYMGRSPDDEPSVLAMALNEVFVPILQKHG